MNIGIKDFSPAPSSVIINDKQYTLKPFSLKMYSWVEKEFANKHEPSGLRVLNKLMLGQDVMCWFKLCYELMEDTSDWKNYDEFKEKVELRYVTSIAQAITECMGISQPVIDKAQTMLDDLKKKRMMSL